MTNRAERLIVSTSCSMHPAICALVEFVARNPGLELSNYGFSAEGRKAYRAESRDITQDWKRFQNALWEALASGVKDEDVIAEAPHAFSGRLEWKTTATKWEGQAPNCTKREVPTDPHWEYTTGQYFPTEYRKAAATLLEYATKRVRQARPAQKRAVTTIAELKALNAENGGCWFDKASMRFFGTRIESGILQGRYFITSEQPPHDSRKFSLRSFDEEGDIDTVGQFCAYGSKADAMIALRSLPADRKDQAA